jgi:nucleotide-binding universal stress UspA family protein
MNSTSAPVRVLIAMYGSEPAGWARQALSAVGPDRDLVARLLVVLDVPRPPFTSLTPWARRRFGAALAASHRLEEERARPIAEELRGLLHGRVDVAHEPSRNADPGGTIAQHAASWGADAVVVAQDRSSALRRALLGAVDARVARRAPCLVVVVPAAAAGRALQRHGQVGALASAGVEGRR